MYFVEYAKFVVGANFALVVAASYDTVPATNPLGPTIVRVELLRVVASIAILNVAKTAPLTATPPAPLKGEVLLTYRATCGVVTQS